MPRSLVWGLKPLSPTAERVERDKQLYRLAHDRPREARRAAGGGRLSLVLSLATQRKYPQPRERHLNTGAAGTDHIRLLASFARPFGRAPDQSGDLDCCFAATSPAALAYWQASQSGLSIEQNFASVAGVLSTAAAAAIAACAAAAKPPSTGTAFNSPPRPVDFSAAVAAKVRR